MMMEKQPIQSKVSILQLQCGSRHHLWLGFDYIARTSEIELSSKDDLYQQLSEVNKAVYHLEKSYHLSVIFLLLCRCTYPTFLLLSIHMLINSADLM